jgi:hypothetical protein
MWAMQTLSSPLRLIGLVLLSLLAGCAAPDRAFPDLADIKAPASTDTTADDRAALEASVTAEGVVARRAGEMVRAGDELKTELPRQP